MRFGWVSVLILGKEWMGFLIGERDCMFLDPIALMDTESWSLGSTWMLGRIRMSLLIRLNFFLGLVEWVWLMNGDCCSVCFLSFDKSLCLYWLDVELAEYWLKSSELLCSDMFWFARGEAIFRYLVAPLLRGFKLSDDASYLTFIIGILQVLTEGF